MKNVVRNKCIFVLVLTFVVAIFCCGFMLIPTKTANAETVDYVNQDYKVLPTSSFDFTAEGVVYKIHCPNKRSQIGDDDGADGYVSEVSFKASTGFQIYFIDGVAYNMEDSYGADYTTDSFTEYYKILHYDSVNQNVYITLTNILTLDYPEDVWIRNGSLVNPTEYIYMSEMQEPVTEITKDDFYFASKIDATGGRYKTGYNFYSAEYVLKINQKVSHLVDSITVSVIKGQDNFSLYQSSYDISDGEGEGGFINFEVWALGNVGALKDRFKLQAVVKYGGNSLTVTSGETDLISLWSNLIESDFNCRIPFSSENKIKVQKFVSSYNAGFYSEIKGSDNHFMDYKQSSDLKPSALIFRIPVSVLKYGWFGWESNSYNGYSYSVLVMLDDAYKLTAEAVKTSSSGATTQNQTIANTILSSVQLFGCDGYLYIRITDDTTVNSFIPAGATTQYKAFGTSKSNSSMTFQANTATIIYDDYNQGLLDEIERLESEVSRLEIELNNANALVDEQKGAISNLDSKVIALESELAQAKSEIAYLTEQIEVMRQEYEAQIDQLIKDNEKNETEDTPTDDVPSEDKPTEEKPSEDKDDGIIEELKSDEEKIAVALALGCLAIFVVALIMFSIPRRNK